MSEQNRPGVPPAIAAASAAAIATLVPISLYQLHVLKKLPDPPGSIFDSEKITRSRAAHPLGIPDGLLGLASFGATLALALAAQNSPRIRKALLLKVSADVSIAAVNVVRQVVGFRKICSWCTGTALCAFVAAAAAVPLIDNAIDKQSQRNFAVKS